MCSPLSGQPTIRDLLTHATARITAALRDAPPGSADSPWLDATVLMRHATGLSLERLLGSMRDAISQDHSRVFDECVARRCLGWPVSYIVGRREFYGREFEVNTDVLVPRPETEILVDSVLSLASGLPEPHIHDCCTGSGCIAISIAAELDEARVSASDISEPALRTARRNAERLLPPARRPEFFPSDLLARLDERRDALGLPAPAIISANPPYLTDTEYRTLAKSAWPEPELALNGGPDGLELLRILCRAAAVKLTAGGYLVVEIGSGQANDARQIFGETGFGEVRVVPDLAGLDRVCIGRRSDGQSRTK